MTTRYEEGSPDYPICIIGEAPSFEEVRKGQPFVGQAGALLDRCLHAAQIPRARCYILNVWEDIVTKKKDDSGNIFSRDGTLLWTSTKGFTPSGFEAAKPCLQRASQSQANVIIPLGGPALNLALGEPRSITKWRGSLLQGLPTGISGRKLLPSLHPSSALKGVYEWRFLIVSDLKKAKRESLTPEFRIPQPNLIIDPTFELCVSFLKRGRDAPYLNTDLELLNSQIDCLSVAYTPDEAICITFIDPGFENRFSLEEERILWNLYAELISNPAIAKVNQNIVFDLAMLAFLNKIIAAGPINDPMVAHSVMNPALSKSLGTICSLYTNEPYYKDDGILKDSMKIADFEKRWRYNARDSTVSLESWLHLAPLLDSEGYRPTYDLTMDMTASLMFMMVHGIKLDETELLATRDRARVERMELVEKIQTELDRPVIIKVPKTAAEKREVAASGAININSPAQIASYLYEELKLKPYRNHAGAYTVDDITLSRIVRRDDNKFAKMIQEYRSLNTLLTRYLEMNYDEDKQLRCSYNIRGTWTGRLSSSETVLGTGGNMQNLDPKMRGFLISECAEATT